MDNSQRIIQQLDKMDEKLDQNMELTKENCESIKLINQSMRGNGGKGLFRRMDETEQWQKEHEKMVDERSKLTREEIRSQRTREATVMAAIIGGIVAVVTTLLTVLL